VRLPTLTIRHEQTEDARELHEKLYGAYLAHEDDPRKDFGVFFPVAQPEEQLRAMYRAESNLHQFWSRRGWSLRCSFFGRKDGFWLWVEPGEAAESPAA